MGSMVVVDIIKCVNTREAKGLLSGGILVLAIPLQKEDVMKTDVSFSCVVKTQRRWSNKTYKTELTKKRYNNQVLGKYRVDPQRAGLTLIVELTSSNLG